MSALLSLLLPALMHQLRAVIAVRTAPAPLGICAAVYPLFRRFHQRRFHRVRLNVMPRLAEVRLVTNVTIPILPLPKRAAAAEHKIDGVGARAFPRLEQLGRCGIVHSFHQDVDVIGHDHPGRQPITLSVEAQQRLLDGCPPRAGF